MRKLVIVLFVLLVSLVCFANEQFVDNDSANQIVNFNYSFKSNGQPNNFKSDMTNMAYPGNKELAVYKDLFFGLTVAFGVAAFTFLATGIAVTSCYGISNRMIREYSYREKDEAKKDAWSDAQSGLLGATIANWSLFTLFAVCGTAVGIIYMMTVPSKVGYNNKNSLTRVGVSASPTDVALIVSHKF